MARLIAKRPTAMKKRDKNVGLVGYGDKVLHLDNTQPRKEQQKENIGPKAHTSFTSQWISTNQYTVE